jgi:hypothetical protein
MDASAGLFANTHLLTHARRNRIRSAVEAMPNGGRAGIRVARELAHHRAFYRKLEADLYLRVRRNIAVRQTPAGLRRRIMR